MDFAFSWANVEAGRGVAISVAGMTIVFLGLVFISMFIAALPLVLNWLNDFGRAKSTCCKAKHKSDSDRGGSQTKDKGNKAELAVAIAYVLHAEAERLSVGIDQKITIERGGSPSNWAVVGRMRTLSTRE